MLKIDTHAHWFPPQWLELLGAEGNGNGAEVSRNAEGDVSFSAPGYGSRAKFGKQYIEIPIRLRSVDEGRVDMHALSLTSPMVYSAKPEFGIEALARFQRCVCGGAPEISESLRGHAVVPMQAPDLAVEEIARAAKLPGIRGLYMATHVQGKNLDEKESWPVYAKCEELGLPIFLHPTAPVGRERMRRYPGNFLGNPYETGIAAASLMFGGVLDDFRKLTSCCPTRAALFRTSSGAWITARRCGRNAEEEHMTKPPSTYLRRFTTTRLRQRRDPDESRSPGRSDLWSWAAIARRT